ncbi:MULTISPECIES: DUF2461 domain-containing protein [unclassified Nocardioides]|uniref:DUF2461 domain-containing protein n=1 Tax=unclassified Nocardioides TaxID=2615069 RepID=UPI0006FDF857|nr:MULTISPECIES: DUF2461 domain-containing protein [unclassified Nocardioides]KRA38736.1 hypothetical protein ASD81_09065 [Nocardioides sp. Root614]KRA92696.1 hypothetical protein ASD84_09330 [Nocardioides sp. Root682]
MAEFTGFPVAALDFYDDLEVDNTKSFWDAHKAIYDENVKAPMVALTDALGQEFGAAKVFRPYRDVRFAKDKTPYKNHQGAFVGVGPATGWYVEVAAPGVRIGGGIYEASGPRLAALREAMADDKSGPALQKILATLERGGFGIAGDTLKTAPRGYDKDHPRIDLLRMKTVLGMREYGFEPFIHTAELLDRVRADWRRLRPLVNWIADATAV